MSTLCTNVAQSTQKFEKTILKLKMPLTFQHGSDIIIIFFLHKITEATEEDVQGSKKYTTKDWGSGQDLVEES